MEIKNNYVSLVGAWLMTAFTWLTLHWGPLLTAACGIGALAASYYNIRVSKAKLRVLATETKRQLAHEDESE